MTEARDKRELTAHQVIALWCAMRSTHFVGVADDCAVEKPVSPEVSRLLDSFGLPFINSDCLYGELATVHKTHISKLKSFFQMCADALPD